MKFTEKPLLKSLSKTSVSIGKLGEDEAAKILKKHGYIVLERNYTVRGGEIDIIARDGEYTCFVEVKLRKNNNYGTPAEMITPVKKARLIKAAKVYSARKRITDFPLRFDAVLINGEEINGKLKIKQTEVIKNAFEL